jgi:hypothetical protein
MVSNKFLWDEIITEEKVKCASLITYGIGKKPVTLMLIMNSLFISMVAFKPYPFSSLDSDGLQSHASIEFSAYV